MASTRIIEQDHGTYAGLVTHHHHNGCYARDFSGRGTVCASVDIASRAGLAGSRVAVHGVHASPCFGDGATVDGRVVVVLPGGADARDAPQISAAEKCLSRRRKAANPCLDPARSDTFGLS
jgi:hypothetical protein